MEFWQGCLSVGLVAIFIVMLIAIYMAASKTDSNIPDGLVAVFGVIFVIAICMGLGAVIQEFL